MKLPSWRNLKTVSSALLACAFVAYFGILYDGRSERNLVVDAAVEGARLAADGNGAFNSAFDPGDGSAAIGVNYRFHSFARWAMVPAPILRRDTQSPRDETRWLYVMADDPQFFSADGYDRVYVGNELVGQIAPVTAPGYGFTAGATPQTILMPPGRTFGYRFALTGDRSCSRVCDVTIRGRWTFWHVYRFAIVAEKPRFVAVRER